MSMPSQTTCRIDKVGSLEYAVCIMAKPMSPIQHGRPTHGGLLLVLAGSLGAFGCGDESDSMGSQPAVTPPERGTFVVPLDEEDPGRGTVELHYIRYPARDQAERLGTLLVHFGGPGSSAVSRLPGWVPRVLGRSPEVVRRFDIVGFDELGVGRSPSLDCDGRALMYPGQDQGQSAIAAAEEFAAACERESDQLDEFGTGRLIRDIERLRVHLGEPELNILGYSYGSLLAMGYASAYPSTTGRIIADAVIDPIAPFEEWHLERAIGFDALMASFLRDCASDSDCAFGGSNPAQAFDALLAELPETSSTALTREDFLGITSIFLTDSSLRPVFKELLREAEDGDFEPFVNAGQQLNSDFSSSGFMATSCVDRPRPSLSELEQLVPLLQDEAPLFGPGFAAGFLPCIFWPVEPDIFDPELEAIESILLLNAFEDPRTPHLWTERVAARIPGRGLIEVEGFQHGLSFEGNRCADDPVTEYLIEGTLPEDIVCPSR